MHLLPSALISLPHFPLVGKWGPRRCTPFQEIPCRKKERPSALFTHHARNKALAVVFCIRPTDEILSVKPEKHSNSWQAEAVSGGAGPKLLLVSPPARGALISRESHLQLQSPTPHTPAAGL
ncbi:UNVERIFIED_CONTAM: hypothetical protein K2H54_002898 [Gekko kuhli]